MSQASVQVPTSLNAWLDRIAGVHPQHVELGLARVRSAAARLRLLPVTVPVITVAGTNGKGSTAHLLEGMLQAAGYRTGVFTSPHLLRYNERVRINATEATDIDLCQAFEAIDTSRGNITLTYFEFSALAALWLFRQRGVDVTILEVGLGGRLDAVNIVDADVAVVTSIGTDHAEWLGHDRNAIAREKAGVMRPERKAICGQPDPPEALVGYAEQIGAPLWLSGRDFEISGETDSWSLCLPDAQYSHLPLPVPTGRVHLQNAAAAMATLHALRPAVEVSERALRAGLEQNRPHGRFQVVQGVVQLIYDVAHNAEAAASLAENLRMSPVEGKTMAVVGMLRDKPARAFAQALSDCVSVWCLGGLGGERGQSAEALAEQLQDLDLNMQAYADVRHAMAAAMAEAAPGDRVLVCGSFYTVAAVMETGGG